MRLLCKSCGSRHLLRKNLTISPIPHFSMKRCRRSTLLMSFSKTSVAIGLSEANCRPLLLHEKGVAVDHHGCNTSDQRMARAHSFGSQEISLKPRKNPTRGFMSGKDVSLHGGATFTRRAQAQLRRHSKRHAQPPPTQFSAPQCAFELVIVTVGRQASVHHAIPCRRLVHVVLESLRFAGADISCASHNCDTQQQRCNDSPWVAHGNGRGHGAGVSDR